MRDLEAPGFPPGPGKRHEVSETGQIAPVVILGTGRCGSTMVSDIVNRHPGILSVSEFFSFVGPGAFAGRRRSGARMWRLYSQPGRPVRRMKDFGVPGELLYPLGDPSARFTLDDLPPILAVTLPHLADEFHELFDECGAFVRGRPRRAPAEHHPNLFEFLCRRLGRRVWVERSGGSLLWCRRLLRAFPDARVIHVFRDGRDTALSMSRHTPFRTMLAIRNQRRPLGLDPMRWVGSASGPAVALLDGLAGRLVRPGRLRPDEVTLADLAWFWSWMIETGHDAFGSFPSDRLLNVAFEDLRHVRACSGSLLPAYILQQDAFLRGLDRPRRFGQRSARNDHARFPAHVPCGPGPCWRQEGTGEDSGRRGRGDMLARDA